VSYDEVDFELLVDGGRWSHSLTTAYCRLSFIFYKFTDHSKHERGELTFFQKHSLRVHKATWVNDPSANNTLSVILHWKTLTIYLQRDENQHPSNMCTK
jgi:hypothetical protein